MPQHNAVHRSTHAQKHLVAALSPLQQNLRQGNHPAPLPSWVVAESVSVTGSSTDFELVYVQRPRSLVPKLNINIIIITNPSLMLSAGFWQRQSAVPSRALKCLSLST